MGAWSQGSIMMHSPGHPSAASTAESRTPSDGFFHEPDAQPKNRHRREPYRGHPTRRAVPRRNGTFSEQA
jgi:hypothetical protein